MVFPPGPSAMLKLEKFLAEITDDIWHRVDNSHFVSAAPRPAHFEFQAEWFTLFIDNRPSYTGPLPDQTV